jgi:hypothetical protein
MKMDMTKDILISTNLQKGSSGEPPGWDSGSNSHPGEHHEDEPNSISTWNERERIA